MHLQYSNGFSGEIIRVLRQELSMLFTKSKLNVLFDDNEPPVARLSLRVSD